MNFSNPILICDENEEFRILIRDMLTKNGFFHMVEVNNAHEAESFLEERNDYFVLITAKHASKKIAPLLRKQKNYIIFAGKNQDMTAALSLIFGVNHIMTYPFHSRKLLGKISALV